jgi:hypothetical protein
VQGEAHALALTAFAGEAQYVHNPRHTLFAKLSIGRLHSTDSVFSGTRECPWVWL